MPLVFIMALCSSLQEATWDKNINVSDTCVTVSVKFSVRPFYDNIVCSNTMSDVFFHAGSIFDVWGL